MELTREALETAQEANPRLLSTIRAVHNSVRPVVGVSRSLFHTVFQVTQVNPFANMDGNLSDAGFTFPKDELLVGDDDDDDDDDEDDEVPDDAGSCCSFGGC